MCDEVENIGNNTSSVANESLQNIYEIKLLESEKYQQYIRPLLIEHIDRTNNKDMKLPKLTFKTLLGDNKIAYRGETLFVINHKYETLDEIVEKPIDNYSCTFLYLGDDLTGHQNIVHGGLLATLLDELTCRLAFQNFHSRKGVTANLNINYRSPCYLNNYVMIKCELLKKSGRKCWVKGSVYKVDLDNNEDVFDSKENLLTECEVLVIEPKWVKEL